MAQVWRLMKVGRKWYATATEFLFQGAKTKMKNVEFGDRQLAETVAKKLNEDTESRPV